MDQLDMKLTEREKALVATLTDCRNTIAAPNAGICDTIWFDEFTTLQDHIDTTLDSIGSNLKPSSP